MTDIREGPLNQIQEVVNQMTYGCPQCVEDIIMDEDEDVSNPLDTSTRLSLTSSGRSLTLEQRPVPSTLIGHSFGTL